MFKKNFDKFACFGDIIECEVAGITYTARLELDVDHGAPWEEENGHGPVSEWTNRPKKPGERILNEDRGSYRYYDFTEAMEIAKRDGWDAEPFGEGTPGQRAARAVEADFNALRAWCRDEWHYATIIISAEISEYELDEYAASLGGIAINYPGSDNSYLREAANEILPEAQDTAAREVENLANLIRELRTGEEKPKHAYIRPVHCVGGAVMPDSLALCKSEGELLTDSDVIDHFPPDTPGKDIKAMAVEVGAATSIDHVHWAKPIYPG